MGLACSPTTPTYTPNEMARWLETLKGAVQEVRGTVHRVSRKGDQIEVHLLPLRGVREEAEAVIAETDVPRRTIVIKVGCEHPTHAWPVEVTSLSEATGGDIVHAVEVEPRTAAYGETVTLKQTIRNVSDEKATLSMGGHPFHNFIIDTHRGKYVWDEFCFGVQLLSMPYVHLEPGEEKVYTGEWEQVTLGGDPVGPGIYLVRGLLYAGGYPFEELTDYITEPVELEILK